MPKKEKIKILRIIARLNLGGPAKHVILLNSGLNKERFSSYLITGRVQEGEHDITSLAAKMDVEPLIIPELKRDINLNNDFIAFLKMYRLMKRLKPHIVHTHTAKAGALGRIAAILNKVPIRIHTFHGHIFNSYFDNLKSFLFMAIEKILANFTNRIIVIGKSQLDDIKDRYRIAAGKKCSVIPLGLDLGPYLNLDTKDDIKKRLSIPDGTLLVGIVGRLVKVKNHTMFLNVIKRIREKDPDVKVKFLIIGDGVIRDDLEVYAKKLKIEDSVIFLGWYTELDVIYKGLDIVCLTSLNEGTPNSLIEAMASGKAVLSTDVGGVRDVVIHNETGILSPSDDIEGFSGNLLKLLHDKNKREELGKKAREFVSERFSKERLLSDIERLYEEELEKGHIR